jgi:hypothetical protein
MMLPSRLVVAMRPVIAALLIGALTITTVSAQQADPATRSA